MPQSGTAALSLGFLSDRVLGSPRRLVVLILAVISVVTMAGCQNFGDEQRNAKNDEELNHKMQCERYAWPIEQQEMEREKAFGEGTKGWQFSVNRVFYSKSLNSCLAIIEAKDFAQANTTATLEVMDALTKQTLWSSEYDRNTIKNMSEDEKKAISTWQ